jgi:4-carboxymuconolactone decarboxylase
MADGAAVQRGKAKFEEVYPFKASEQPSDFEDVMYRQLFGEVWQRPGLSTRDRRLMVIGVAAAQCNDSILRLQMRSGLAKGDLSEKDLEEITIFLTQYVGYPLGTRVRAAAQEAVKQG